ncbi:uncharacterized protein LOC110095786 isoform X2 [Dendrobium catenatum]|uniref:B3 domain-containing protein n=1 Tax=Dendrobium catenatum TaxID=906689 RepID=A0A2I0X2J5_9ASPA|nr:uncharacterized protein LOC110095786 isoform X2 [Dendrobium catenatum]PKU82126.1 B3 domain-containing protein [Dendrobium catenatum]
MQASLELSAATLMKKRGRKPSSRSPPPLNTCPLSFFKVLLGDFKDVLFIPPMAACTLKGLAKKYVYIEDAFGKYWNVKMSMVDGSLAFQNGWCDFVSDHCITVGEFVLFTYTGGLIFAARIFGTNALERVNFKVKRRRGIAKERCITELKPGNVRTSKRKKTAQPSEEQHSPFGTEVQRSLKRKQKAVKCDFPKVHVIESDSISEGVLELSSAGEKPLYDSNSKESENALLDSEQTWHKNSDATVGELNIKSPSDLANSDLENIEAVSSKSIINRMSTSENGAAFRDIGGVLPSKQTAEEPDAMTKTSTWAVKGHSDNKEWSAEISGSQVQMNKEDDDIRNNGKTEQGLSHDLEMLDREPPDMKMASLSNLKHAECSPKMEFNLIKPEVISEIDSGSQVQMKKEHDAIINNGKTEQGLSHDLEMLDSESNYMKIASLSNLEHAECSPKMELNLIKPEEISEMVFLSADAICHPTLDEKLIELATGASFNANELEEPLCGNFHGSFDLETSVPCQNISAVSSNPILNHTIDKMENLMIISEEYGVSQTTGSSTIAESGLQSCNKVHECKYKSYPEIVKGSDCQSGIADDTFFDEDEKNVTPCSSRRCKVKIDRSESVDIPSSSCVGFSICLSDDVQSSLELQKKLACQLGKFKHERKIIVLQDPSLRCWPVLYHQSNKYIGFIGGWVDFAKGNNICGGDICEFELINKMELKFRVHITKAERSNLC